jgi:hypothetical protein
MFPTDVFETLLFGTSGWGNHPCFYLTHMNLLPRTTAMLQARNTHLVPSHSDHLPSQKSDLRRKRQILWADIMASEQGHAAKDAVVVVDQLVKIVVAPLVTRVEAKARDLVEPDRACRAIARRLERPFCSLFSACRPAAGQRRRDHHFAEIESPVRLRLAE